MKKMEFHKVNVLLHFFLSYLVSTQKKLKYAKNIHSTRNIRRLRYFIFLFYESEHRLNNGSDIMI